MSKAISRWLCVLLSGVAASAGPVLWTDWISADASSATGAMGVVTVTFTGVLDPAAQTYADSGIINWWSVQEPYISATVDNPPWPSEIIRLTGGTLTGTQTITFSAPVKDPIMAIFSLGKGGIEVTYDFDADFTVLHYAPGYFGDGALVRSGPTVLTGIEANGLIQFPGTFTSISWTIPVAEDWHGFQIAIPVPEPSTLVGAFTGLGAMVVLAKRRRKDNPAA